MRGLDPRIHTVARHAWTYVRLPPLRCFMDGRVKPGHDVDGLVQTNWKRFSAAGNSGLIWGMERWRQSSFAD
jgi:hypothetical protein